MGQVIFNAGCVKKIYPVPAVITVLNCSRMDLLGFTEIELKPMVSLLEND